jgi:hypothetical protein
MFRSPLAVIAVAALSVGCVTISGPTASPSATTPAATPTKAPTVAPTVPPSPTSAPTAAPTPTLAPTNAPTDAPTLAPTLEPTAAPTEAPADLDTRDLLFNDDMTDTSSGWATGTVNGGDGSVIGTINYTQNGLAFNVANENGWLATSRVFGGAQATVKIAAEFVPQGAGRFGLLCDSNDTDEWGAVIDTDGTWLLGKVTNDGFDSKVKDENSGLNISIGQSTLMVVECTGLITGKLRITLWMEGTGPVATYETDSGPDTFNRVGAYAEARGAETYVSLANVLAFGAGGATNEVSDAASALMTHIPSDWLDSCYQSPRPPLLGRTAEAVVTCFIRKPGANGPEIVEYASYLNEALMNSAYQQRISVFGSGDGNGSCADGSGEHVYNIDGHESGHLLCVDQFRGIRFDWTDTRLNILSSMVDFDGDYAQTFSDWQSGGPDL